MEDENIGLEQIQPRSENKSQTNLADIEQQSVRERPQQNKKSGRQKFRNKKFCNDKVGTSNIQIEVNTDGSDTEDNDAKCRYCFGGPCGWVVGQPLIIPCKCSGSLAYAHRSCLEKWLTIRQQSNCDLCRYNFVTKRRYKNINEIQFAKMKTEDICGLLITVLVYVTFILQLLTCLYIGILADHIPAPIFAVCITGLSIGVIWFLVGCIALTVLTYTSEYWEIWRETNKILTLVMDSIQERNYKNESKKKDSTNLDV